MIKSLLRPVVRSLRARSAQSPTPLPASVPVPERQPEPALLKEASPEIPISAEELELRKRLREIPSRVIDEKIYAPPREITDIDSCHFYHVMDLPGYGVVGKQWDLRGREDDYLGGVCFEQKRVLELGTASGHLCRFMESRGADVVGFDLGDDAFWDAVPFAQMNFSGWRKSFQAHIEQLKNGWWFCHKLLKSKARAVYGNIYNIPREIGPVDITTAGSILLHLQNPFVALQSAARLTKETMIVTDIVPVGVDLNSPVMTFIPNFNNPVPDTWWRLTPAIVVQFLGILGFERTRISYHMQKLENREFGFFTVVGHRTREMPPL